MNDKYTALQQELIQLPFISPAQIERWVQLQKTIDGTKDYLIRPVPSARVNIETAQKILAQRSYTLVFFGGTGVGKSTLINALLGRNLLPSGAVTAVTGTIVYIEQAQEGQPETLTLNYWSKSEFVERVHRLCQLAALDPFDITDDAERDIALNKVRQLLEANRDSAKTEQDEYYGILLDCIATYENNKELFKTDTPAAQEYTLNDEDGYLHLREDSFKGTSQRQIRIIKSATFRIHPPSDQPNLLLNGYLRIVDVPGLGAGMRLHETITLEEMKKEDAMIVLVSDAGRQRVDELKSLQAVHWVKDNRLRGLKGADLDDAAAKIFYVVNGGNIRQAFDRLTSGLPSAETEVKEVTRHIAPNYWEQYKNRGNGRPYFLVMPPAALYVEDPVHAPSEFLSETRRIFARLADQLSGVNQEDPLDPDTKKALLTLSEVPLLRERLIDFIKGDRVRTQLREAESRVLAALDELKQYYEKELAARNVYPPFNISWESLQERRFDNLMRRVQTELPRLYHASLVELSQRTNNEDSWRRISRPVLDTIKERVQQVVNEEVTKLMESYGSQHWDDRDVTYDNLVWGTSGIELPEKRILYQVELRMQEELSKQMPRLADVMSAELKRTLQANEVASRLNRATYGQEYTFTLPHAPATLFTQESALTALIDRVTESFREICEQATMYELVRVDRSIHAVMEKVAQPAKPSNGTPAVGKAQSTAAAKTPSADEDLVIRILDEEPAVPFDDIQIEPKTAAPVPLKPDYTMMLNDKSEQIKKLFGVIIEDLFSDGELLTRLRRLFWLEATKSERDFNNSIVKPLLRQHDRRLHDEAFRAAMEPDLESVSELEALMRTWEGLDQLSADLIG